MPLQAWATGPASSRSLQLCSHLARDFVGLSPRQQPLHLPGKPRGPSPAHLHLADSSTMSGRLDTSSEPAAVCCGPRRAPGPSLHPPPGRMAALTAQMCEPGRGLPAQSSQPRGPAPARVPGPSQLLASRSPTGQRRLPCSEGSPGGGMGEGRVGGAGWEENSRPS